VVGAWHLALRPGLRRAQSSRSGQARGGAWVVDVGGTTTDIALLQDDRPRLNPQGAQVGRWRTMVEAADVHTVGLGGDSQVRVNGAPATGRGWLSIGPRRVLPLCLLADQHPQVVDELQRQVLEETQDDAAGQFLLAQRRASFALPDDDRVLLDQLAQGPRALAALASTVRYSFLLARQVEKLRAQRLVLLAGFTPSDALHVLGLFERWDGATSRLGAELLAARAGLSPEEFCRRVVAGVSERVATELVSKVLGDETALPDWENEPTAAVLLARALRGSEDSGLDCQLTLKRPLVAIGAPVAAYLPRAAERLHTELVIPDHAGVANAVGAVAGGVVQQARLLIHPLAEEGAGFRVHLPGGVRDFDTLAEGVAYAQQVVPERLEALARQAGAAQVEVRVTRKDRTAPVRGGWGRDIYLGTELTFSAVGRPSLAREAG
jgi:N-methylhydantoinase A/oxoprolinase/acetone carboxylase beta subunit